MKWYMRSWLRPSNSSDSVRVPGDGVEHVLLVDAVPAAARAGRGQVVARVGQGSLLAQQVEPRCEPSSRETTGVSMAESSIGSMFNVACLISRNADIINRMVEDTKTLDRAYAALADPTRRYAADHVPRRRRRASATSRRRCRCRSRRCHVTSACSRTPGLVRREVRGREHWLSVRPEGLAQRGALDPRPDRRSGPGAWTRLPRRLERARSRR